MAGGIEFLGTDPPAGVDEPVTEQTPPRRPGSQRVRSMVVIAAVVALVGGGLIARAVSGSDPAPTAVPSASPLPSYVAVDPVTGRLTRPSEIFCGVLTPSAGSATAVPTAPVAPSSRIPGVRSQTPADGSVNCSTDDPAVCPEAGDGLNACVSNADVPAAVLQAARARYPGLTRTSARTEIVRETHRVWYRLIVLRHGSVTVRIVVQQSGHEAGSTGEVDDGSQQIIRAVHAGRDTTTIVEVTQPSGGPAREQAALALAADPRLVAAG